MEKLRNAWSMKKNVNMNTEWIKLPWVGCAMITKVGSKSLLTLPPVVAVVAAAAVAVAVVVVVVYLPPVVVLTNEVGEVGVAVLRLTLAILLALPTRKRFWMPPTPLRKLYRREGFITNLDPIASMVLMENVWAEFVKDVVSIHQPTILDMKGLGAERAITLTLYLALSIGVRRGQVECTPSGINLVTPGNRHHLPTPVQLLRKSTALVMVDHRD